MTLRSELAKREVEGTHLSTVAYLVHIYPMQVHVKISSYIAEQTGIAHTKPVMDIHRTFSILVKLEQASPPIPRLRIKIIYPTRGPGPTPPFVLRSIRELCKHIKLNSFLVHVII